MIPTSNALDKSTTADATSKSFFRCPIPSDKANGVIRIGRRRLRTSVQETSIDGFTVVVSAKEAPKLQIRSRWVLEHNGTEHEIHPEWFFNSTDGHVQLGLRRLRDLTQPGPIRRTGVRRSIGDGQGNGFVILGGAVLIGIALLSMPGVGEKIADVDSVKSLFRWMTGNTP